MAGDGTLSGQIQMVDEELRRPDMLLNHYLYDKSSTDMGGKAEDASTQPRRLITRETASIKRVSRNLRKISIWLKTLEQGKISHHPLKRHINLQVLLYRHYLISRLS